MAATNLQLRLCNLRQWAASAVLLVSLAGAAHAAELYEGKTISLVIGFEPGGMADADGRTVAQYLGRHIPGNPRIVVQNKPGAGGINSINAAYQVSRPDGLSIYQIASAHMLQQLAGSSAIRFNLGEMPVLGTWIRSSYVLVLRASTPFQSVDAIRKAIDPPKVATQGLGTGTFAYTVGWQKALGLKFQLLRGYEGNEQNLALERGEIDGRTDTVASIVQRSDWKQRLVAVVQNGPDRDPLMPDVPAVNEVTTNPGLLWNVVNTALSVDRPYVLSPKTPDEFLVILRKAWDEMLADPDLLAEAARRHWRVSSMPYDKLESFYRTVAKDVQPETVAELKELFP